MKKTIFLADLITAHTEKEARVESYITLRADEKIETESVDFSDFVTRFYGESRSICYFYDLKSVADFLIYALTDAGYKYTKCGLFDKPEVGFYAPMINASGEWFAIKIHLMHGEALEIRDLSKLCPLSYEDAKKAFSTHVKPVFVMRDIVTALYEEDIKGLTIGSSAINQLRQKYFTEAKWERNFPSLSQDLFDFFEEAYFGGWVICAKPGKHGHGFTLDANSLYPYILSSDRLFPVGYPKPMEFSTFTALSAMSDHKYFIVRFSVSSFTLKPGALPFIERKNDIRYARMGALSSSAYMTRKGLTEPKEPIVFTMTETDYKLFIKYYDVKNFRYISGYWFRAVPGKYLFGDYVGHWYGVKKHETGGKRQIAKLMLNAVGGKFAASRDSDYRVPVISADGSLIYDLRAEKEGNVLYIPVGCALTAYGREYTIETAQANADIFAYGDTDSVHCVCDSLEDIKGVHIDAVELGAWKVETEFTEAKFLRQKAYVEKDKTKNAYIIKCAGLPEEIKSKVVEGIEAQGLDFFSFGMEIPGKPVLKHVKGGSYYAEQKYTLCESALDRL